jgi:hypothetical protein
MSCPYRHKTKYLLFLTVGKKFVGLGEYDTRKEAYKAYRAFKRNGLCEARTRYFVAVHEDELCRWHLFRPGSGQRIVPTEELSAAVRLNMLTCCV